MLEMNLVAIQWQQQALTLIAVTGRGGARTL